MRGLAPAALVAVIASSGCGAHAVENAPSLDEVAAATRADSYRFDLSLESAGVAEPFTGTATGAADPSVERGVIRYSFDNGDETITLEVRIVGEQTYSRFTAPGFPGGWTTEIDEALGPFGAFSEPHHAADALARHGRDVETESGGQVDGVSTTHYRATVPTLEIMGGGLTEKRRVELESEIRKTGSEVAAVDAWAGADGVLRKLEFAIPIREDGREGRFVSAARFFDFGKPVEVEAPPVVELETGLGNAPSRTCRGTAEPHAAEAVMDAFRAGGFSVRATCFSDQTTILAFPKDGSGDDVEVVACEVYPGPEPREDLPGSIVAANVACDAPTADLRAAVRTLLDGL